MDTIDKTKIGCVENTVLFLDLVWTKARLNLKAEANRYQLHYLWWVIEPLLLIIVYYVVFAVLLGDREDNYVPYLISSVIPFQWFAKTIEQSANSIVLGRGLMNQIKVSPLFFPISIIVQNAGKQLPVFIVLGVLLPIGGTIPTIHWLVILPIIILQLIFMLIVCCLVAMIIPFMHDLLNLVPLIVRFTLFCSGVFYTLEVIPEHWHSVFLMNPIANLLHQYRLILVDGQWPDWFWISYLIVFCIAGGLIARIMYKQLGSVLPRVVLE